MNHCRMAKSGDVSQFVPHVNTGFEKDLSDPVTSNGSVDMTRAEGSTGVLCKHGYESCGYTRRSVNMVIDLLAPKEAL
jgi:hypothetical protein